MRRFVERVYIANLVIVFGLVVVHAPLVMALGTWFMDLAPFIKGWKEVLLVLNAVGLMYLYSTSPGLQTRLNKEPIVWLIGAYCILHVALSGINWPGWHAYLAGMAIDLRYVLFFLMVYVAVIIKPDIRQLFLRVGLAGAIIVFVFAILQLTILPRDVLTHIGYSFEPGKIAPYTTVDSNDDYIRATSTLRGPNPFGAYSLIVLSVALCWAFFSKSKQYLVWVLAALAAIMAWFSYSRSALLGVLFAVAIIVWVKYWQTHRRYILAAVSAVVLASLLLFTVFRHSNFVSTVIFHDSPGIGAVTTSNDGHIDSLYEGLVRLLHQPLGAGIGSTGSPSYYSEKQDGMFIVENQYLNVAHESGWIGLVLYVTILAVIIMRLRSRLASDWLAVAVFSSGAGLLLASFFLPVFVDDTVAYIWWGLAGLVVASVSRPRQSLARRFIQWNIKLSKAFDKHFVPRSWRVDGLEDYREMVVPPLVKRAKVVYDLGGG